MTDVDRQIARSAALLERTGERYRAGMVRRDRADGIGQRVTRIAIADGAILLATIIFALVIGPIGLLGAVGIMTLLIATTLALAIMPGAPAPTPEKLREVPLKALPAQTERWLATQRAALPAPAISLIDQIGVRLETLSPQLAMLDENELAATEVRKLVGEQLPEFIKGYTRVPPELRRTERNGSTPDAQLLDGLRLIEKQIGEMTTQLAEGDLDQLATRGRFLEIKYRGDGADAAG